MGAESIKKRFRISRRKKGRDRVTFQRGGMRPRNTRWKANIVKIRKSMRKEMKWKQKTLKKR